MVGSCPASHSARSGNFSMTVPGEVRGRGIPSFRSQVYGDGLVLTRDAGFRGCPKSKDYGLTSIARRDSRSEDADTFRIDRRRTAHLGLAATCCWQLATGAKHE